MFTISVWACVELCCGLLACNAPYIAQAVQSYQTRHVSAAQSPKLIHTSSSSARPSLGLPASWRGITSHSHHSSSTSALNTSTTHADEKQAVSANETITPSSSDMDDEFVHGNISPTLDLRNSPNYFEALFNPPGPYGPQTRRNELETGLQPGKVIGAMRRQLERLESVRSSANRSSPPLSSPPP